MASQALDLTTIGHAFLTLAREGIGGAGWTGFNPAQKRFLEWYAANSAEIGQLDSLEALASKDFQELNAFMVQKGFDPMFDAFDPSDSLGVVSILDMLVEWLEKGTVTTVARRGGGSDVSMQPYPAFEVPSDVANVYEVQGFEQPLVQLRTKTGHSVWLMKHPASLESGLDLAMLAQDTLEARRSPSYRYAGAVVPKLELQPEVDMEWLTGTETLDGKWYVDQAFQVFKLRANEKGARVKVATGMTVRATSVQIEEPFVFDEPFVGFFTQPGHDKLALAAFWADTDSWREPEGSLEEL
jgi:hypothetical protein